MNRQLEQECDVIVIGGGVSGICAAIQSALAGAKTILVERTGRLGGTLVNAMIDFPGLFHAWGRQVIAGIGWDLVVATCEESGQSLPDFSQKPERHWHHQVRISGGLFSLLADEAALKSDVVLQYHTMVAGVEESASGVIVDLCTKTGLKQAKAKYLIDCTGDANAVVLAGGQLRIPGETQPATLSCRASGYNIAALDRDALQQAAAVAVVAGELRPEDLSFSPVTANPAGWLGEHGNNSNHLYGINAVDSEGRSRLESAAAASVLRAYRFLRKQPGLETLSIDTLSAECGVRETATIVGRETITVEDYLDGKVWGDALCYSFYPVDLHDKNTGLNKKGLTEGVVPTIGRGALLPKGLRRLIAAGRIVSSDRLANSALRVQASCMAMGQAAGAIAALSSLQGVEPDCLDLLEIRALLKKHGAIIPV